MGCTCSHQDIKNEQSNETFQEDINNKDVTNNNNIINSDKIENENDNFLEAGKLKGAPPQAGFEKKKKYPQQMKEMKMI